MKERFEKSDLHRELVVDPLRETMGPTPSKTPDSEGDIRRGMGFNLTQFKVLTQRYLEIKFKDSAQTVLLLVQAPVVALLVALMASGPNQVQTLFMAVFSSLWFGCSNAVREIVDEQAIYRRERQTGLKIPSYIFSKLAVLSGVSLVQCVSVVFVLMVVGGALRLGTAEALQAVVIMFLVSANGTLIGLTLSAMVGTAEKALTLFPLILIPELLLCGLFLPIKRIPMIIPLTVEELFEGQIYAQPEAKARAGKMMAEAAPQEPAPSGPVLGGRLGNSVIGAIDPSEKAMEVFHKYTPTPIEGMSAPIEWLSAVTVSRWGLEALADLCLHGSHSTQDYAFKIINTISVTLHPQDLDKIEAGLEAPLDPQSGRVPFPLPSRFWPDKGPYLSILASFLLLMTVLVLILMKRKDAT